MGVPLFADHIKALTASFDLNLADVRKPLLRQLGQMPGYSMQVGHGPHYPPLPGAAASPKHLTKFVYNQFATEPVWAQN
jgi:hypothetical protein